MLNEKIVQKRANPDDKDGGGPVKKDVGISVADKKGAKGQKATPEQKAKKHTAEIRKRHKARIAAKRAADKAARRAAETLVESAASNASADNKPLMDEPTKTAATILDDGNRALDKAGTVLDVADVVMSVMGAAVSIPEKIESRLSKPKPEASRPYASIPSTQKPPPPTKPALPTAIRDAQRFVEPRHSIRAKSIKAKIAKSHEASILPPPSTVLAKSVQRQTYKINVAIRTVQAFRLKVSLAKAGEIRRLNFKRHSPPEQKSGSPNRVSSKNPGKAKAIAKFAAKLAAKGTFKSARAAVEQSVKHIASSADSVSDKDAKAAMMPIKSAASLVGSTLRPKSFARNAFVTARKNIKSAMPDEIKEAAAPAAKATSTIKVAAKTTVKTAKTAKKTAKTAKKAVRGTVSAVKIAIKIMKAIKFVKIATAVAKVVAKIAKVAVKAVAVLAKAVKAAVAVLVSVKALVLVAVFAAVAVVILAVVIIFSWFIPDTDVDTIIDYTNLIMQLDQEVNNEIISRTSEADDIVFIDEEFLLTDLRRFYAIFILWQNQDWANKENEVKELHYSTYSLSFTEQIFYITETHTGTGIDEHGNEYRYTYTVLVQQLRVFVNLRIRSVAEIVDILGMSPGDVEWIYTIMEYIELPRWLIRGEGAMPGFYQPFSTPWIISSPFGYRPSPFFPHEPEFHPGIDIPKPTGTPILAIADGDVILSGVSVSAGNWIRIDHGYVPEMGRVISEYMHNSTNLVSVGDTVNAGDIIALVGSTGWSTGPHLHLNVIINGVHVNPLYVIGSPP